MDWLAHPVTEALRTWARGQIEEQKALWVAGKFTDQGQFGTAIMNAEALGKCEAYGRVVAIDLEELRQPYEE